MNSIEERKRDMCLRTKSFAAKILHVYLGLDKRREELRVLGKQLLRSGTSVAANYREASRARSAEEFIAKAGICIQEADESQLWLELLRDDCGVSAPGISTTWQEADELIAIFTIMIHRAKGPRASHSL